MKHSNKRKLASKKNIKITPARNLNILRAGCDKCESIWGQKHGRSPLEICFERVLAMPCIGKKLFGPKLLVLVSRFYLDLRLSVFWIRNCQKLNSRTDCSD